MCTKTAVLIRRCLCMPAKKATTNMHTLPCKYHCDELLLFFFPSHKSHRAVFLCVLYRVSNRQHTDRHHFSHAFFFCVFLLLFRRFLLLLLLVLLLLMERVLFISFRWCVLNSHRHTQSSISCVLANDKDTPVSGARSSLYSKRRHRKFTLNFS